MNALHAIRSHLLIPTDFGPEVPFLRFTQVAADAGSGEDLTLGFQEEGAPQVHLSHTEWQDVDGRAATVVLCSAIIDWTSGAVSFTSGDEQALAAALLRGSHLTRVS